MEAAALERLKRIRSAEELQRIVGLDPVKAEKIFRVIRCLGDRLTRSTLRGEISVHFVGMPAIYNKLLRTCAPPQPSARKAGGTTGKETTDSGKKRIPLKSLRSRIQTAVGYCVSRINEFWKNQQGGLPADGIYHFPEGPSNTPTAAAAFRTCRPGRRAGLRRTGVQRPDRSTQCCREVFRRI